MFYNRLHTLRNSLSVRDHKTEIIIRRVSEILHFLELNPQCRLLDHESCSMDCCDYHCDDCVRNALMVPIIQDCLTEIRKIGDMNEK